MIRFWGIKNKQYAFLSNFYYAPILIDGKEYFTVEHYYQSVKFSGTPIEERIRNLSLAKETKKEAYKLKNHIRKDWIDVREDFMYKALRAKFIQHPRLKKLLLDTKNHDLIEDSPYDEYWGSGGLYANGKNRLGVLLMQLREELRREGNDQKWIF
jgi:N-glycosidase YbiA